MSFFVVVFFRPVLWRDGDLRKDNGRQIRVRHVAGIVDAAGHRNHKGLHRHLQANAYLLSFFSWYGTQNIKKNETSSPKFAIN